MASLGIPTPAVPTQPPTNPLSSYVEIAGQETRIDETVIGDNPVYDTKFGVLSNNSQSTTYQEISTLSNYPRHSQDRNAQQFPVASLQDRDFDNPIYGSECVREREFDNPVYAANGATIQTEPEDLYTVPETPPSNIYDRVASDDPLGGGARMGIGTSGGGRRGMYST